MLNEGELVNGFPVSFLYCKVIANVSKSGCMHCNKSLGI